jgi:ferredoxin
VWLNMSMKLRVDVDRCMGNARCSAVAPELFELNDEGYVEQSEITVPAGLEEKARIAVDSCPEQVITIVSEVADLSDQGPDGAPESVRT